MRPFIIFIFFALESRLLPERGNADETRKRPLSAAVPCGGRACPHASRSGRTAGRMPPVRCPRWPPLRFPAHAGFRRIVGGGPCVREGWAGLSVRGGRAAAAPEAAENVHPGRGRPRAPGLSAPDSGDLPMGVAYAAFPAPGPARLILKRCAGESRARPRIAWAKAENRARRVALFS